MPEAVSLLMGGDEWPKFFQRLSFRMGFFEAWSCAEVVVGLVVSVAIGCLPWAAHARWACPLAAFLANGYWAFNWRVAKLEPVAVSLTTGFAAGWLGDAMRSRIASLSTQSGIALASGFCSAACAVAALFIPPLEGVTPSSDWGGMIGFNTSWVFPLSTMSAVFAVFTAVVLCGIGVSFGRTGILRAASVAAAILLLPQIFSGKVAFIAWQVRKGFEAAMESPP